MELWIAYEPPPEIDPIAWNIFRNADAMAIMGSSGSERRVRRQFSGEFKAGAVRLVIEESKTIGAVARGLDLTASALSEWVKHAEAEPTKGKSGLMNEEREELARLRKEVRFLAEERDIPLKATDFFATQSR